MSRLLSSSVLSGALAGIHNYSEPDWKPLERAVRMAGVGEPDAPSLEQVFGMFMWVCEQPAGQHWYKSRDTRQYAKLQIDTPEDECRRQLAAALGWAGTWGKS